VIHTRLKAALLSALAALAACTGTGTDAAPAARRWQPQPRTAWQWQLSGKVSLAADVPVYDIDGFDNTAGTVAALHRRGRKAICYISVGAWEDVRPDAAAFPKKVLGRSNGWDGERWLDIRRTAVLRPLMAKRFDMCRTKGFDAVEPDNTDGYRNRTGFKLTAADQLTFNRMIAKLAHDRGMAVGLKNDLDQIPQLLGDFDFAAGKAVFHVEYNLPPSRFCDQSGRLGLSSMEKRLELGARRAPCPTAVAQSS
jgi:hypothetical protein